MITEMQSGRRSHTHSPEASDRTRSLVLPKITVEPGPGLSQNNPMTDDDADSFSISSKSEQRDHWFFPYFDGTKEACEYPVASGAELPWDEDTLAGLPARLRQVLQLEQFQAKQAEYLERLQEINDKAHGYHSMVQGKRPKYEILFYQKKQNQLKEQLEQELKDYEATMAKMKLEIDKKIDRFHAQASRRLSFSS